jgi:hypothetical protein
LLLGNEFSQRLDHFLLSRPPQEHFERLAGLVRERQSATKPA